jgi:hypothetical protein
MECEALGKYADIQRTGHKQTNKLTIIYLPTYLSKFISTIHPSTLAANPT